MKINTTKEIIEESEKFSDSLCEISDDPYSTVEWMQHWSNKWVRVDDIKDRLKQCITIIDVAYVVRDLNKK